MVKPSFLPMALLATFVFVSIVGLANAQRQYHLEHQWAKIWINQNGSIDLFYDIEITLDSGPSISRVYIGQPQSDFTIGPVVDQYGRTLTASDASQGSNYRVQVNLNQSLAAGETIGFNLTTNVARMIYEDTTNPGNVGMKFIPTWWEEASVLDLKVSIVVPPGVTVNQVKTLESAPWNNTLPEDSQLSIYWEKQNLAPDERFPVGVSFPKEFVQSYVTEPTGFVAFWQRYGIPLFIVGVIVVGGVAVVLVARKKPYLMPKISMETLGVRHGFTAVEASYLLDFKPTMIVTEILYSLLQKRAVWVESTNPSLKLKMMPPFENKVGPEEAPLRYYEIDFLNAVKEEGSLDEEKLARTVTTLRDTVEEKMRGYCRRDTVDYYRKIVDKAWGQVEQAGTPELASKAYDEQLLWLFLDPNRQSRTETVFRDKVFEPSPLWWWYWYGYGYYHPKPTYKPNIEAPSQAGKPPSIPGADFANNIATAVENTSNNIVANLEKFANAIVPMPAAAKASSEPARHGSGCICACAACACACACVSCACACAGGGVG